VTDERAVGPARTIGVVGAGTMGAGIAQLAAQSGAETVLYDPVDGAAAAGAEHIGAALTRGTARGRWTEPDALAAIMRVQIAADLEALAPCDLVVEAAPEDLALKRDLLASLSAVAPRAVLASNTSSIPISAIATAAADPSRVVGMHFFNPAPAMRLVEVIAGIDSGADALALATATGEAMGKRVIPATDGPGFLVNRCSRPFGLEALRLLQEQLADVETIDAIVRRGGGYRMGPFELQDLVGIDTGFAVARSFAALSFGEPRWRPSPLSARMVAAGRLGRKTGQGWYTYTEGEPHRPDDPPPVASPPAPPDGPGGAGLIIVAGWSALAEQLRDRAAAAGWDARKPADADGAVPWLVIDCGAEPEDGVLQGGPQLLLLEEGSLAALNPDGGAAGFFTLAPLDHVRLVELTRGPLTTDVTCNRSTAFFATLGMDVAWVGDAPGLVLGRIVAQLVNECAFAITEGVGKPRDIDDGLVLGLNHPRGPLAWADEIGVDRVLAVLDALWVEYREERYRAAPLLRRIAAFHE
jgi:3-hydroxybutyryl-CoA dehydrogenase